MTRRVFGSKKGNGVPELVDSDSDDGFVKLDASGDTSGYGNVAETTKGSYTPQAFVGSTAQSIALSGPEELKKLQRKTPKMPPPMVKPPPPAPYIPIGHSIASSHNPISLADFDLLTVIGKGSFGKVLQVRKKSDNRIMAMKIIKKKHIFEHEQQFHTITERTILAAVPHPFIPRLHYAFQSPQKLYMAIDIANGGELFYHLHRFVFLLFCLFSTFPSS